MSKRVQSRRKKKKEIALTDEGGTARQRSQGTTSAPNSEGGAGNDTIKATTSSTALFSYLLTKRGRIGKRNHTESPEVGFITANMSASTRGMVRTSFRTGD